MLTTDELTIPVTKGCGVKFTINRGAQSQIPIPFSSGAHLEIDTTPKLRLDVVCDASTATVVIPAAIADRVRTKFTRWRVIADDTPVCLGVFERLDG